MLTKSQQLLLIVGLCCVSVASSADVDCSKRPKFVNPMSCCPIPEFISAEVKEKCQQFNVTPTEPPPMSGEQSGEGRRYHHHHPHHKGFPPPCFVSCIFNETGIYEDNKLDEDNLDEYLKLVFSDDDDLQDVVTDAFVSCAAKISEWKSKKDNRPRPSPPPGVPTCPHRPAFLMGCVFKNVMKNCPASIRNDSQECNDAREYFKACRPHKHLPASGEKPAAH